LRFTTPLILNNGRHKEVSCVEGKTEEQPYRELIKDRFCSVQDMST